MFLRKVKLAEIISASIKLTRNNILDFCRLFDSNFIIVVELEKEQDLESMSPSDAEMESVEKVGAARPAASEETPVEEEKLGHLSTEQQRRCITREEAAQQRTPVEAEQLRHLSTEQQREYITRQEAAHGDLFEQQESPVEAEKLRHSSTEQGLHYTSGQRAVVCSSSRNH